MKKERDGKGFLYFVEVFFGGILTILLMGLYALQTYTGWPKEGGGVCGVSDKTFTKKKSRRRLYPQSANAVGRFFCWGLKNLVSRTAAFFWLRKVRGLENLPVSGPFLVVPNHQSFMDFMLVIFALKQVTNLTFFVKKPYFDMPLWKFFLSPMGHIRADRTSVRKALNLLQKEHLPVVLFAEGTRTRTGKVGDAYPGFGRIAKKIPDLKIIPVGISGAFEVWPWDRKWPKLSRSVDLTVGEALTFANFQGEEKEFSQLVMNRIHQLAS